MAQYNPTQTIITFHSGEEFIVMEQPTVVLLGIQVTLVKFIENMRWESQKVCETAATKSKTISAATFHEEMTEWSTCISEGR